MWSIILGLLAAVIGVLIGLLLRCDWSPVVRRRYINLGWDDGMRWEKPYTPKPGRSTMPELGGYFVGPHLGEYVRSSLNTSPTTELDMSRRCFDYYMTGYEQALDYERQREGIIATRMAHLGRIQRLDTEIRAAAKELKEEA